ncbi:MAG TPA: hypothetical protein VKA53_03690, partial [Thermoanaerobaculia bacterium]|nr:hypothetical protein [Thermoanaerobaculia bacterium]
MIELKNQLGQIEQKWEDISKEMKPLLEKQQNELHKYGEAQKATSSRLDEHSAELVKIQEEHKRLSEVIKELEVRGQRQSNDAANYELPGDAFAKSAAYKTYIERGKTEKWSSNLDLRGGFFPEIKADDFFGSSVAGDLVTPQYIEQIIALSKRMPLMRRLLTTLKVKSDTIVRKREIAFYDLVTKLTAAAIIGATEIYVES